jgi:hypothetical protein
MAQARYLLLMHDALLDKLLDSMTGGGVKQAAIEQGNAEVTNFWSKVQSVYDYDLDQDTYGCDKTIFCNATIP